VGIVGKEPHHPHQMRGPDQRFFLAIATDARESRLPTAFPALIAVGHCVSELAISRSKPEAPWRWPRFRSVRFSCDSPSQPILFRLSPLAGHRANRPRRARPHLDIGQKMMPDVTGWAVLQMW